MVRKIGRLPPRGGTKAQQQNPTFKQRFDEAERRRAVIMQRLAGLNESGFNGYCLAEIPESKDPVRVLQYFRSLWLAYQNLL